MTVIHNSRHVVIPPIMGVRSFAPRSAAAAGNGLLNALIAYWPGNEESGDLLDAHTNGIDLTDTNTVTYAAGKVYTNARQYTTANSEYHTIADNASLSMGDIDFTISAWVYLTGVTSSAYTIVSKWDSGNAQREYWLAQRGLVWQFLYSANGASFSTLATVGSPSANTWYMVTAWHDSTANKVYLQINDGEPINSDHATGIFDGTAQFYIGARVGADYFAGRIGPLAIWKSSAGNGGVLTEAQRTALYNGGDGLAYASFTT